MFEKNKEDKIKKHFLSKVVLVLLLSLLFPWSIRSSPLNPENEPLKSQIQKGIHLTINNQFDQAIAHYGQMISNFTKYPIGYFYRGATIQAKLLDSEEFLLKDEFYRMMQKTIQISDSLQKRGETDEWILFFKGNAYLYESFMNSKENKWFPAYKKALKGVRLLEDAVKLNHKFYDAYLGIGSYKYWKSAKAGILLWLPIIKDEKELGIKMIKKSIENGIYTPHIARDQLCWILIDAGQYQDALNYARQNSEKFPRSRFFKWTLAEAAYRAGDLETAFIKFSELLREIKNLDVNNHYNEISCLVKLAEIEMKNERPEAAEELAQNALKIKLTPEIRERSKNKLKRALELFNKADDWISDKQN